MGFFENRYEKMIDDFELVIPSLQYLRINTLKDKESDIIVRLKARGIKLKRTSLAGCYSYESDFSVASTTENLLGRIYLQGLASQTVAHALAPKKDWFVVDMAAAPGSKTTHVAQLMKNAGRIIALDNNARRLEVLRDNCARLGIVNTITVRKDARYAFDMKIEADAVILDAPCSGNYCSEVGRHVHKKDQDSPDGIDSLRDAGDKGRREAAAEAAENQDASAPKSWFAKRKIEDIKKNARTQKELMKAAFQVLKPGGVLIYSTCSLEPEEDELVVQYGIEKLGMVLEKLPLPDLCQVSALTEWEGKKLDPSLKLAVRFWPHRTGTEGFFVARLRKQS